MALDLARRTAGVKMVVNDLTIRESGQIARTSANMPEVSGSDGRAPSGPWMTGAANAVMNAWSPNGSRPTGSVGSGAARPVMPAAAVAPPVPLQRAYPQAMQANYMAARGGAPQVRQVAGYAEGCGDGGCAADSYGGDYTVGGASGGGVYYDNPSMPDYAWPSYASHPNYAAVTYPRQYSPTAWPYIGPFYPYPQVPLGWRKVSLEWDDGWWWLDFTSK